MNQAEAAAARAIAEAEAEGGELKNRAIQESKEEVARMIVLGIEKLAKNSK
jgi:F0F1-type ATP synthase membrane subunit b/b'